MGKTKEHFFVKQNKKAESKDTSCFSKLHALVMFLAVGFYKHFGAVTSISFDCMVSGEVCEKIKLNQSSAQVVFQNCVPGGDGDT